MADDGSGVETLLDTPHLAEVIESDRFKRFLDHAPFGIAVSELHPSERLTYANPEFERLTGVAANALQGRPWNAFPVNAPQAGGGPPLGEAVTSREDYIGRFALAGKEAQTVDAWSSVIEDESGTPIFRLVALARPAERSATDAERDARAILEKDTQLRELQHRVKNNLQMITALIRLEARNAGSEDSVDRFDRLAGRVEALALLYRALSDEQETDSVDLGTYLSQIASTVMQAHAVEGIHLVLEVDSWPVSVNVAMPTGLVVNELMTNALKHAFTGRGGGTILLKSLVDETGCRITVADDGIGLQPGFAWPTAGKLSALIVESLRQNAGAKFDVSSSPGEGVTVAIFFARAAAAPEPAA